MSDDRERLLAEALRAQARFAPPAAQPTQPVQAASPTPHTSATPHPPSGDRPAPMVDLAGGYGLLSGADDDSLNLRRAAQGAGTAAPETPPTTPARGLHRQQPERLPIRWVLLLASSLGLAVGSIAGLITLL